MRVIYQSIVIAAAAWSFTTTALARQGHKDSNWMTQAQLESQVVVIDLDDQLYQGRQTIYLKQEIKKAHPYLKLKDFELDHVELMAKSHNGGGGAELIIDGRSQGMKRVYGTPDGFNDRSPRSFDNITLGNYTRSRGLNITWQLELGGNIKVRRIKVQMHTSSERDDQGRFYEKSLGTIIADKATRDRKVFQANTYDVSQVIIDGLSNETQILNVYIEYLNGQSEHLYELEGTIERGQRKVARIHNRNVARVVVTATTRDLFGGRGKIEVLLATKR